jgi:hypothetical protein
MDSDAKAKIDVARRAVRKAEDRVARQKELVAELEARQNSTAVHAARELLLVMLATLSSLQMSLSTLTRKV